MKEDKIQNLIIGLVVIIILVKCLKRIIREPRPIMKKDSTFGMPSTRAASIFFLVVYLILVNKLSNTTYVIFIFAILFCCGMKYLLEEHSINQLTAGAILGTIVAYSVDYVLP